MLKNDLITLGDVQNVYTRQTVTLAPNELRQIDGVHTFLRIYDVSGNIEIAAQNSGIFQRITAGTWIKNPLDENGKLVQLPYIRLHNLDNNTVTVDLALSNGEVGDDAFLGTAKIQNTEASPIFTTEARPSDFKVTPLTVPANDSITFTPDTDMISFIVQNQSTGSVFLYDAAGIEVLAGADFTGNINKSFGVFNNTASAAAVVVLEALK